MAGGLGFGAHVGFRALALRAVGLEIPNATVDERYPELR